MVRTLVLILAADVAQHPATGAVEGHHQAPHRQPRRDCLQGHQDCAQAWCDKNASAHPFVHTAHQPLGIPTVAVFSDADRHALHVSMVRCCFCAGNFVPCVDHLFVPTSLPHSSRLMKAITSAQPQQPRVTCAAIESSMWRFAAGPVLYTLVMAFCLKTQILQPHAPMRASRLWAPRHLLSLPWVGAHL